MSLAQDSAERNPIAEDLRMAVRIRLRRQGRKKAPTYRIIVADGRSPRDGRKSVV